MGNTLYFPIYNRRCFMKNKKNTKTILNLDCLKKAFEIEVKLYGNNSLILEIQVRRKIHE